MKTNSLTIPSILSLSLREIRNRFRYLFILALIGPICNWLVQGCLTSFDPQITTAVAEPSFWAALLSLVLLFVSAWSLIAFVLFVCKRADTFTDVFLLALKRLPRFIGGLILYFVVLSVYIFIALLLIMFASFLFGIDNWIGMLVVTLCLLIALAGLCTLAVYFVLLPYLLILTDISILWTFPAAYTLVKNRFWQTLALLLVIALISMAIYLVCLVSLGVTSVIVSLLIPPARYFFSFLTIIPAALALLANQIPLIAIYVDRLPLLKETNSDM